MWLKSCATCELVLPLGEPQRLIRSDGLGPGEGGGVVSCMEQRCFLEATGRDGTRDSLKSSVLDLDVSWLGHSMNLNG